MVHAVESSVAVPRRVIGRHGIWPSRHTSRYMLNTHHDNPDLEVLAHHVHSRVLHNSPWEKSHTKGGTLYASDTGILTQR